MEKEKEKNKSMDEIYCELGKKFNVSKHTIKKKTKKDVIKPES